MNASVKSPSNLAVVLWWQIPAKLFKKAEGGDAHQGPEQAGVLSPDEPLGTGLLADSPGFLGSGRVMSTEQLLATKGYLRQRIEIPPMWFRDP